MRFPVSVKPFCGQLHVAAFAGVLLLLVLFVLLVSLVHTPGVNLRVPFAGDLLVTDHPTLEVALDSSGRYYFQNQFITETALKVRLREAATNSAGALTLVVQPDRMTSYERWTHLIMLAREAGINDAVLATSAGPFAPTTAPKP
jgi:biopolymer transport protein ExbD